MKIFDIPILDSILSILITMYIIFHVVKNIKEIFEIFLEKAPKTTNFEEFKKELLNDNLINIIDVHHTHVWTMDGTNTYITMHVLVKDDILTDDIIFIKHKIKEKAEKYNIQHTTVEIEYEKEKCTKNECEINCNHNEISHHHHHLKKS